MLFQSAGFLFIFLPLFLVCMALAPAGRIRGVCLLVFSYLFYSGSEPYFMLLLLISSVVDYTAALRLSRARTPGRRKAWLILSICVNLGLLGFYKYGNLVIPHLAPLRDILAVPLPGKRYFMTFALPAGISFYTFQSMSYTIDVYRGRLSPERSFLGFCNYVAYLPQLIAGPIERFSHLAPQLKAAVQNKLRPQWSAGLDRLALGVAEKLLIADSCGLIVDIVAQNGPEQSLITSWTLAVGFGMQILFDFAAYTHMAIGISLLLGVRLSENFLAPYQAPNPQQFWRRWHVTLSNWFRDYLFIPLGGSRKGRLRTFLNIFITFALCGLWHGAGWNFAAWGVFHGILLGGYHVVKRLLPRFSLPRVLGVAFTFLAVQVAWVLFRVNDVGQVLAVWKAMFGGAPASLGVLSAGDLVFLGMVTALSLFAPCAKKRWPGGSGWAESLFLWALALFAVFSSPQINQFIYFRF